MGIPWESSGEDLLLSLWRPGFNPWVGKMPLEKGMATHSGILAWRIPWTDSLVGYSPWSVHVAGKRHKQEKIYIKAGVK